VPAGRRPRHLSGPDGGCCHGLLLAPALRPVSYTDDERMARGRVVRRLECDCGEIVEADTDDLLVEKARTHARQAHDLDLPAQLILLAAPDDGAERR
jgi:hypothetical protein